MIYDNAPLTNRYISVPKDFGSFNCAAFVGGILEGMLEQTNFVSASSHTQNMEKGNAYDKNIVGFLFVGMMYAAL